MKKKKFYAVKVGRVPGVYTRLDKYLEQVSGFSGSLSMVFKDEDSAQAWLDGHVTEKEQRREIERLDRHLGVNKALLLNRANDASQTSTMQNEYVEHDMNSKYMPTRTAVAYIDGSYNEAKKMGAYGVFIVRGNGETALLSGISSESNGYPRGSVAAELEASAVAIRWCMKNKIKRLIIVYDCISVSSWATRNRGRASQTEIEYKRLYRKASKNMAIEFKKIKSHIGNKSHDVAETLAKQKLGLNVKKTYIDYINSVTNQQHINPNFLSSSVLYEIKEAIEN